MKNHYEKSNGLFSEVLFFSQDRISWEETKKKIPEFPKGWYELSCLNDPDRIEFTKEYWLKVLPFVPKAHPKIIRFFQGLDDVGIYAFLPKNQEKWQLEFIYSLKNEACFFRGGLFAREGSIQALNQQLQHVLPKDYLAFFQIHNGFARHNDIGILHLEQVIPCQKQLERILLDSQKRYTPSIIYERDSLIPFYECFGLHSFQCFFKEWYPTSEIGNVYFSGVDYTISKVVKAEEDLAFESFSKWLAFYLEGRET